MHTDCTLVRKPKIKQLRHTKRNDGLSQLPTSFTGPKALAKLTLIFYLFSRLKSRLGWSGEDSLSWNAPQNTWKCVFKRLYLGKYPLYISYESPLGRHFCCAEASAPRWHWLLYPSAAQWHDGPTQREMLQESAHTVPGHTDAPHVCLCFTTSRGTSNGL